MKKGRLDGRCVAVTGAAGFIGSHVASALAAHGADVRAIDRSPGWRSHLTQAIDRGALVFHETGRAWPYGGLDRDALDGVDTVLHFAYAEPQGSSTTDSLREECTANLLPTLDLLEALPDSVTTFGFASTALVYGRRQCGPLSEPLVPDPDSPYALAKVGVEQALASRSDRRSIVFRLSTVYGPTETVPRAVPNFIRRVLAGLAPQVAVAGDRRDYVHVTDVAEAFVAALLADLSPFEVLNVGTGVGVRTDDLARLVASAAGVDVEPEIGVATRAPVELVTDPARTAERTGFTPAFDLEHGLQTEVDWFRTRPDLWDRRC